MSNAVATLYNYIGSDKDSEGLQGTYRGVYDYNTFTTDEAIIPVRGGDWYDGGFWADLYTHKWAEDSKPLYDTWKYLYKVIVFCNDALTTIDNINNCLQMSSTRLIGLRLGLSVPYTTITLWICLEIYH